MSSHRLRIDVAQPVGTSRVVPSVVPPHSVSTETPILGFPLLHWPYYCYSFDI
jgi:hypothetical protein